MKYLSLFLIVVFSFVAVNAQGRNPQPTPQPTPINSEHARDQQNISNRSRNLQLNDNLRAQNPNFRNTKTFRDKIKPLYRDPDKKEREILAPDGEDENKYADFLKQKGTGLTKLIIDQGCDKDVSVVVSTPHCLKYSMPGAGSSFSFRIEDYRIRHLSDLNFTGKVFQSVGVLTHGIFADIGDVPLEDVTLETDGVDHLTNIQPAETIAEATDLIAKLEKGIKKGEFTYKNFLPVKENTTYVLRSIAYRGNAYRTIGGISYDELDFDKRKDITVAFRIVRVNPNEGVTILWKELAEEKAPKIKPNK